MKLKVIKHLIKFLFRHWPYLVMDVVIPDGKHIHSNPRKRPAVTGQTIVPNTHTAAMASRFPETAKVDLSHLGVVGILNVDNPRDPRNRGALP